MAREARESPPIQSKIGREWPRAPSRGRTEAWTSSGAPPRPANADGAHQGPRSWKQKSKKSLLRLEVRERKPPLSTTSCRAGSLVAMADAAAAKKDAAGALKQRCVGTQRAHRLAPGPAPSPAGLHDLVLLPLRRRTSQGGCLQPW